MCTVKTFADYLVALPSLAIIDICTVNHLMWLNHRHLRSGVLCLSGRITRFKQGREPVGVWRPLDLPTSEKLGPLAEVVLKRS